MQRREVGLTPASRFFFLTREIWQAYVFAR